MGQIKAACKALKFKWSVTAKDTLPHRPDGSTNPRYTKLCQQMGILNTARVDIEMAGEYLRDEISSENEAKCTAWKRIDQKKKQSASKRKKQPILAS